MRGKARRRDRLPLPVDVGEALAGYVQRGRPHVDSQRLFWRVTAPIGPLTGDAVNTSIRANHVSGNGDNIAVADGPGNQVVANVVSDARGCPFCDPPTGFGIVVVSNADETSVIGNVVSRTVWDGIRIGVADFDEGTIDDAVVRDNVVRDAKMDGIRVDTDTAGTKLKGNTAKGSGDDGIDVDSAATTLVGNFAAFNHDPASRPCPG